MDKGEITKGLLDDLEKELDSENSGKSHLQGGSGKEIYSVKHKYGALSETKKSERIKSPYANDKRNCTRMVNLCMMIY